MKEVRDLNIQWMIGDYNKVKCRSLRGKSENRGNNRMEGDGSQKKGKRDEGKGVKQVLEERMGADREGDGWNNYGKGKE